MNIREQSTHDFFLFPFSTNHYLSLGCYIFASLKDMKRKTNASKPNQAHRRALVDVEKMIKIHHSRGK